MRLSDLEPGAPNLDGMHPDDLERFHKWTVYRLATLARRLFPGKETLSRSEAVETLGEYAFTKAVAMRLRADGEIEAALSHEKLCDKYYRKLPTWARW